MSQPTAYVRQFDFSDWEENNPDDPAPGTDTDAEFNAVKLTLDEIMANLALIQRDDGEIANETIGLDQLSSDVLAQLGLVGIWATTTSYAIRDTVAHSNALYVCLVAHTAGSFATDLAAGKWALVIDYGATVHTATSDTSLSIGTGSKGFLISDLLYKDFPVGTWVLARSNANPTVNYFSGQVTANDGATLTVNMTSAPGTGTHTDWTITMAGPTGATGAGGATGQGVPTAGTAGQMLTKVDSTNYNTQWTSYGTAALVNTGTSGATIPLLNAANTWSANQTISKTSATASITVSRTTTNAADGVLQAAADKVQVGSTSADNVELIANNTAVATLTSGGGIQVGSPTGGDKGAGKINCTGLYVNNVAATSVVLQAVSATPYTANTDLTVIIPRDDTIPQNTEGTQILTATITPQSATSKVRITATVNGAASSSGAALIAALFKDAGANAIYGQVFTSFTTSVPNVITLVYEEVPGDTSAHTYNIRVGAAFSFTMRCNGGGSGRLLGGVMSCTMVIEEIAA